MFQFALPFRPGSGEGPPRIVIGDANASVAEALHKTEDWPFRTAILTGPRLSGKSLFARWFEESGRGEAIDDAPQMDEHLLFHRWNRAQELEQPLLLIAGPEPWNIALPDLRSRLGAAMQLEIQPPDDNMAAELLLSLAQERSLPLGPDAAAYLVPRAPRGYAELVDLVAAIDRISLERKAAPTLAIWRAALEELHGRAG
ncbi:ATPase [Altericroceibacterium spongiae]|uniref:ATPase n=1 Tax=Altericroceibacterium spongiae TaxID=2320269 RepID=A0A420ERA4_9SPHN|nr:ATPase [Altericroceibacterium spongiae]RKF23180.1 ATPase [Altericroceibacterium spongiae]